MILEAVFALALQRPPDREVTQFLNGNEVLEDCRNLSSGLQSSQCTGYIQGVVDMEAALQLVGDGRHFCVPVGGNARQLRDIVVQYLEAEPATRHMNGALLVALALKRAFPCT